jgi:DNA-binding NarL/FixJ family response regulator
MTLGRTESVPPVPPPIASCPGSPVRVLVADDSAGVRELLVLLLNMEQTFTVVGEARDGEAAVSMAKQLQPDLVILDVSMPRLDGIEALPKVRAVSPSSRVVIFSGESDENVEAEARAAGATAVIAKDVGATTLVERLHTLFIAPRVPGDELPAAG